MLLVDLEIDGQMRKTLVHFDCNGFAYTLDRQTGELLVAEKYEPAVNWATEVDMETGRPQVVAEYSTHQNGVDGTSAGICPAEHGPTDQTHSTSSPKPAPLSMTTNTQRRE